MIDACSGPGCTRLPVHTIAVVAPDCLHFVYTAAIQFTTRHSSRLPDRNYECAITSERRIPSAIATFECTVNMPDWCTDCAYPGYVRTENHNLLSWHSVIQKCFTDDACFAVTLETHLLPMYLDTGSAEVRPCNITRLTHPGCSLQLQPQSHGSFSPM